SLCGPPAASRKGRPRLEPRILKLPRQVPVIKA
ncbi:hypothetical protein GCK32_017796, partial [Trichostrongylus colubriformis]